jgi:3-dehydroquinate synthase
VAELQRLQIAAGQSSHPVVVGKGALAELPALLGELGRPGRLRVIADEVVADLHGERLLAALRAGGQSAELLAISGRERDKNLTTVSRVYDWLVEAGTDRSDTVIAFGGGVIGDLAGFAAATYLRGVRLIHLPTTLLAMVDSSIGGKTGVDHPAGKNLVGAFYQPALVVADLELLATLPPREVSNGWAEVIKMGVIRSPELFERLEQEAGAMLALGPAAAWAIAHSIRLKGEVVAADERESDLRMILNYGHTIGHAIEAATGYERYLHGEAVAIGMTGAAELAHRLLGFPAQQRERQVQILRRYGLPIDCPTLSSAALRGPMGRDKKAVGARLRWVLPRSIGEVVVKDDVPEVLVERVLAELTGQRRINSDTGGPEPLLSNV